MNTIFYIYDADNKPLGHVIASNERAARLAFSFCGTHRADAVTAHTNKLSLVAA